MRPRPGIWLLACVLVVLAMVLVVIDQSDGHTLSIDGARRTADRKAASIARSASRPEVVRYRVVRCLRARTVTGFPKPHTVDCTTDFDFTQVLHQRCRSVLRVSFRSATSTATTTRLVGKPSCEPL